MNQEIKRRAQIGKLFQCYVDITFPKGKGTFNCNIDATVMIYVQFSCIVVELYIVHDPCLGHNNLGFQLQSGQRLLLETTEPVDNGCA